MVSIPSDLDGPIDGWVPPALTGVRLAAVPTAEIERVAALLRDAERPVIIAGGGAQHARTELVAVAERFSAGVYAGFRRQDVFPNDHPLYLGHLAMNTPPRTVDALREADGVVVFGSKLAQMTSQRFTVPRPGVRLAQVDIDPARIGMLMPVEVGVVCDARIALAALAAEPGAPARDWSRAHATFLESTVIPPDRSTGAGVDPSQIIRAMAEVLPEDTVITSEAGGHATFGHQHWLFRHPRTQAAPQNGTMGYAVPAAVAAKIALPDRVVVADVGDGGFLMTGQEIETSVRENAPIIVVVFNNSLLSAGFETASMRENRPYNLISTVDFAAYARAMGAQGITVTSTEELVPAFEKAHHAGVTTVLDVRTDADIFSPRLEPLRM
jgi:acetolactate synthase-1/2/3 large subunit